MWEELRRQLGPEFAYGPGNWFCVPHEHVKRDGGRVFSTKSGGDGRRVVLATAFGPNATLFARSASVPDRFSHPAHQHEGGPGRCRLNRDGWINLRIPVNVPSELLCNETYSCKEPDDAPLRAELARAVAI